MKTALKDIKDNEHKDDQCDLNCINNGKYFKEEPYACKFRRTTGGGYLSRGPESLLQCDLVRTFYLGRCGYCRTIYSNN